MRSANRAISGAPIAPVFARLQGARAKSLIWCGLTTAGGGQALERVLVEKVEQLFRDML
jgi:hypothetical protein